MTDHTVTLQGAVFEEVPLVFSTMAESNLESCSVDVPYFIYGGRRIAISGAMLDEEEEGEAMIDEEEEGEMPPLAEAPIDTAQQQLIHETMDAYYAASTKKRDGVPKE